MGHVRVRVSRQIPEAVILSRCDLVSFLFERVKCGEYAGLHSTDKPRALGTECLAEHPRPVTPVKHRVLLSKSPECWVTNPSPLWTIL